jgi:acyl-[acyl-carrier-protein] desaturase
MGSVPQLDDPAVQGEIYRLYRAYFDRAEKKRRWSVRDDIPWDQCNPHLDPAIADVVQTFCSAELFLPDYLSKLMPLVRSVHGRAWFLANWGYEESKHSLALGDWLLLSGQRSEEQMADLEHEVSRLQWNVPYDSGLGMVCYTVFEELATSLHYKNLRGLIARRGGDPALDRILYHLSADERAHYDFFRRLVELYLGQDRPTVLEELRHIVNTFRMPAVHMFDDGARRAEAVKALRIFDEEIFLYDVFEPALAALGVHKSELRRRNAFKDMPPSPRTAPQRAVRLPQA